jgi:hypothetical protein
MVGAGDARPNRTHHLVFERIPTRSLARSDVLQLGQVGSILGLIAGEWVSHFSLQSLKLRFKEVLPLVRWEFVCVGKFVVRPVNYRVIIIEFLS